MASAVALAHGERACELLVYADMPLEELQRCVAAGFPALAGKAPVALRHAETGVFYPLSLVARAPDMFEAAVYEVVAEGDSLEGRPAAARKGGATRHHRRRHHAHAASNSRHAGGNARSKVADVTEGGPATTADEDGLDEEEEEGQDDGAIEYSFEEEEEEKDDDDDDDEFVREIDLTDFELPTLVNVFAQACPTGSLDRSSFERCLEKILSQVSGCPASKPCVWPACSQVDAVNSLAGTTRWRGKCSRACSRSSSGAAATATSWTWPSSSAVSRCLRAASATRRSGSRSSCTTATAMGSFPRRR